MPKEDEKWWARNPNARAGPILKSESKTESKSEIVNNRSYNAGNDVDWIDQCRGTTPEWPCCRQGPWNPYWKRASREIWLG